MRVETLPELLRMGDFLSRSAFLKTFSDGLNTAANRRGIVGALTDAKEPSS